MPTSILDLPTELILEIIHSDNSTDATTIAHLGMTCRRLHGICQVLVLERQLPVLRALASRDRLLVYKNCGSIAMKDEEFDDVKGIFQTSFHKIEYVPVTLESIREEIAGVHGLILNANAVGHIIINLDLMRYTPGLPQEIGWSKPLVSLIRVSSEKNMASLTIKGSIPNHAYIHFIPLIPIPDTPSSWAKKHFSIFGSLKDRIFGHKTRTQPNLQVGAAERERLPNTGVYFGTPRGLKSFEIHSSFPFHHECFPQTLRALNGGYLTKLTLWNTRLRISDWGNILPLLSMPLLSEFNVLECKFAFRDLSPFLRRHSNITHFSLTRSSLIGPIMPPADFLPHLEVISANPDYLLGLLSRQRHLFPRLRSVSLTEFSVRAIQHESLDNVLRNLADRKRGTIHLSITFWQPNDLTECFSRAKSKPYSLDCVKTLEIIRFGFPFSSEMCDSFFSWVSGVFPYVQELDLTQMVPPHLNMWTWRLDALWDSCPELRSVIVGVDTYQRPAKAVQ